jgi:hypothetical protein
VVSILCVADRIAAKEVGTSPVEITAAVHAGVRVLDAGEESQKSLVEIVPPILRRFYGLSHARLSA